MAETMMRLGPYRFALGTAAYQELNRASEYRWARQERIGRNDALQYTGPGPETIELRGVIYPHFRGGLGQLDRMRATAGAGFPMLLIDGRGRILGLWCVETVNELQETFAARGAPLKQEFDMRITRYDGGLRSLLPF